MKTPPPDSTLTDPFFPFTMLFRSRRIEVEHGDEHWGISAPGKIPRFCRFLAIYLHGFAICIELVVFALEGKLEVLGDVDVRCHANGSFVSRRFEPVESQVPDIAAAAAIFAGHADANRIRRSEEHTSELQPLTRSSYAVFCLKK